MFSGRGMHSTRIKICGITCVEDGLAAAAAGADAIGLVFYPKSSRYVGPEQAAAIARAVGPFVTVVGLFVDPTPAVVQLALESVPLQLLQFHGNESPAFCASFTRPFIKALRMDNGLDVAAAEREFQYAGASGLLLDSFNAQLPGGTGETFDWTRIPRERRLPLILAGGLSPANVAAAVRQVHPYAVDVSSGMEYAPGRKDSDKITGFVRAVREADQILCEAN